MLDFVFLLIIQDAVLDEDNQLSNLDSSDIQVIFFCATIAFRSCLFHHYIEDYGLSQNRNAC